MRIFWGLVACLIGSLAVSCKKKVSYDARLGDFGSLNLTSILSEKADLPDLYYDKDLYAFVSEYIEDAKNRGVIVSGRTIQALRIIRWVDRLSVGEGSGVMAACSRYYVTEKKLFFKSEKILWTMIEVLRGKAQEYTDGNRILLRELLYHELTHCLLEKGHLPDGVEGIMSAVFTEGNHRALKTWSELLDDHFSTYDLNLMPNIGS
jgi:hypothetical protein